MFEPIWGACQPKTRFEANMGIWGWVQKPFKSYMIYMLHTIFVDWGNEHPIASCFGVQLHSDLYPQGSGNNVNRQVSDIAFIAILLKIPIQQGNSVIPFGYTCWRRAQGCHYWNVQALGSRVHRHRFDPRNWSSQPQSLLIMAAPCCPPGSHGPLPPDDVELKGWWERKADLDCYFTGEKGKPSMIILAFSDVFGPMSGKHRRVCDQMASAIHGSLICLPDLFEGEPLCPDFCDSSLPKLRLFLYVPLLLYRIRYRHGWEQMLPKIQGLLNSFQSADSNDSAVPISCFGFCFGAYLAVKGSALGAFRASVGFHPSLVVGRLQCSPHGQGHADLAREVKCPQMMLPAGNDDAAVKPNGDWVVS